jgi:hypothetical protein
MAKFKTRLTKNRDDMPQQLERVVCMSFKKGCLAVAKEGAERFELN